MQRVVNGKVGRGHSVVAHGYKDLQIRIARECIPERDAGIDIAVVCIPVPGARDAAPENVVLEIGLISEFGSDVVVEGGSVGRSNRSLARIKVGTIASETRVKTFEPRIQPANRSPLRAEQFFSKEIQWYSQVCIVDKL